MAKRGRPKKALTDKLIKSRQEENLSDESRKKVEQGLKEAKAGQLCPNSLIFENNIQVQKEQQAALKKTANELTKQFGHEIIHFASEETAKERIPTGIPALDKLITGFPAGAFSVIWGNKGCTKTTTTYYLIAQAQKIGKSCLYLDLEHSFDSIWATHCGVDCEKLLLGTGFINAEEAMDTAIKLANEKVIDVIILDSVQALSPKGEQEEKSGKERSISEDTMALLARRLSIFFRISGTGIYKGKVTFILVGQARTDLGAFIKLEKLTGGKALTHYATLIIKAYRASKADAPHYKFKIKDKNKSFPIGFQVCFRLEKKKISHTAPEETEARENFYNEFGFQKPTNKEIETLYKDWLEFESEGNNV